MAQSGWQSRQAGPLLCELTLTSSRLNGLRQSADCHRAQPVPARVRCDTPALTGSLATVIPIQGATKPHRVMRAAVHREHVRHNPQNLNRYRNHSKPFSANDTDLPAATMM